jgi:dTDP-4-amino-4,6-dideoxygalactose transaminase
MIKFLDLSISLNYHKNEIQNKLNKIIFNKTNFILGVEVKEFENNFANYIQTQYCVGVANGTDALEIAFQSLNLDSEDEVITQANTYVASCFGIVNNKYKMKLVDCNSDSYQMDLDLLEKSITPKTKAVLIVHLTGSCCNMDKLMNIINKHNLILIEDCAQSHGAYFKDKRLGTFGLLSTFSFYPGKNLGACGDGGAICTNNENYYNKILKLRNNGSIIKYHHEILGRNSRLDTIQAAILDTKLKTLDIDNQKRRSNVKIYRERLSKLPKEELILPYIEENCVPVYHLFIIKAYKRDELKKFLYENNIETGIHYPISVPELKCFESEFNNVDYQNSIDNSKKILSLPMYPDLKEKDIHYVCDKIIEFYINDFPF